MKQLTRTQRKKTLMTIDLYDILMKCNMIEDTSDSIREVQLVFAPWEGGGGGNENTKLESKSFVPRISFALCYHAQLLYLDIGSNVISCSDDIACL
jgi:hypothetical protein